jgi:hypothetical protein
MAASKSAGKPITSIAGQVKVAMRGVGGHFWRPIAAAGASGLQAVIAFGGSYC